MAKAGVDDLALTSEQERELKKYAYVARWAARAYHNSAADVLLTTDDLAQEALIAIIKGIKRWGMGGVNYKQRARWACLQVRRIIKRRRELVRFVGIDRAEACTTQDVVDLEYDKRAGYMPDYDRCELLGYAEEFIASLSYKDRIILEHLFALNDAEYLRDTEIARKLGLTWGAYWSKRRKLIQRLRNAPKIKEILQCQT